jgi:hypothetical protein
MRTEPPAAAMFERIVALGDAGLPVLRATRVELKRLERIQDRISSQELAAVILRDPLMTLRVLQFLYHHRTRSQTQDITTIAHAIMMLGFARFFREFSELSVAEDQLHGCPDAPSVIYAKASQARLASLFARDWATLRHDMDPEEVMVAALVHDAAQLLLFCVQPDGSVESSVAEQTELRTRWYRHLGLPGLLDELTRDTDTLHARVVNVTLACDLARLCANGWNDPQLAPLLERIQRLLHISAVQVWEHIRNVALRAAAEWRFYRTRPAAAYLIMQEPCVASACTSASEHPR